MVEQVGIKFMNIQDISTILLTKASANVSMRVDVTKSSYMTRETEFVVNMVMENTAYTGTVRKIISYIS